MNAGQQWDGREETDKIGERGQAREGQARRLMTTAPISSALPSTAAIGLFPGRSSESGLGASPPASPPQPLACLARVLLEIAQAATSRSLSSSQPPQCSLRFTFHPPPSPAFASALPQLLPSLSSLCRFAAKSKIHWLSHCHIPSPSPSSPQRSSIAHHHILFSSHHHHLPHSSSHLINTHPQPAALSSSPIPILAWLPATPGSSCAAELCDAVHVAVAVVLRWW